MNPIRILISTVVLWLLHVVWYGLVHLNLFDWVYKLDPVVIWRSHFPHNLFLFAELVFVLFFVLFYAVIESALPSRRIGRGLVYGLFIWLVGFLPILAFIGFVTVIADGAVLYLLANFLILSLIQGGLVGLLYRRLED